MPPPGASRRFTPSKIVSAICQPADWVTGPPSTSLNENSAPTGTTTLCTRSPIALRTLALRPAPDPLKFDFPTDSSCKSPRPKPSASRTVPETAVTGKLTTSCFLVTASMMSAVSTAVSNSYPFFAMHDVSTRKTSYASLCMYCKSQCTGLGNATMPVPARLCATARESRNAVGSLRLKSYDTHSGCSASSICFVATLLPLASTNVACTERLRKAARCAIAFRMRFASLRLAVRVSAGTAAADSCLSVCDMAAAYSAVECCAGMRAAMATTARTAPAATGPHKCRMDMNGEHWRTRRGMGLDEMRIGLTYYNIF